MGVEIELFHVFALLGSPLTTLAIVLAGLLLSSGAGSYLSSRFTGARPAALAALFASLAVRRAIRDPVCSVPPCGIACAG
jgi:hypothetical protein